MGRARAGSFCVAVITAGHRSAPQYHQATKNKPYNRDARHACPSPQQTPPRPSLHAHAHRCTRRAFLKLPRPRPRMRTHTARTLHVHTSLAHPTHTPHTPHAPRTHTPRPPHAPVRTHLARQNPRTQPRTPYAHTLRTHNAMRLFSHMRLRARARAYTRCPLRTPHCQTQHTTNPTVSPSG